MTTNIMIVGVGGQGSLLASRIVGHAALSKGYDVKVSEVHGMSQRGGSVVTYIRFGECVHSPVICKGEADIIISFESLEAARWLPYLKKGGTIITNTGEINPMPVIVGSAKYPENIISRLGDMASVIKTDAQALAIEAGSEKTVNVVLMGLFAHCGIFTKEELEEAVRQCVPKKLVDTNIKAFELGYKSR